MSMPFNETVDESLAAVIMPPGAKFSGVYETLRLAVESSGMHAQRTGDIGVNDRALHDVVSLIARSKVVICDLTHRNYTVFYKLGVAHTMGRDVIMLAQSRVDVPFHVEPPHYIVYASNRLGLLSLSAEVTRRLVRTQ